MLKRLTLLLGILVALGMTTANASAASILINHQGVLLQNGEPVDSLVTINFSIYEDSVGGTPLWSETQSVQVDSGLYNVHLGASEPLDLSVFTIPLEPAIDQFYGYPRYVEVEVPPDPPMTPRQLLTVVPFAASAGRVQGDDIRLDVDADGNNDVVFGNPPIGFKWDLNSDSDYDVEFEPSSTPMKTRVGNEIRFEDNSGTERMRIHSAGTDFSAPVAIDVQDDGPPELLVGPPGVQIDRDGDGTPDVEFLEGTGLEVKVRAQDDLAVRDNTDNDLLVVNPSEIRVHKPFRLDLDNDGTDEARINASEFWLDLDDDGDSDHLLTLGEGRFTGDSYWDADGDGTSDMSLTNQGLFIDQLCETFFVRVTDDGTDTLTVTKDSITSNTDLTVTVDGEIVIDGLSTYLVDTDSALLAVTREGTFAGVIAEPGLLVVDSADTCHLRPDSLTTNGDTWFHSDADINLKAEDELRGIAAVEWRLEAPTVTMDAATVHSTGNTQNDGDLFVGQNLDVNGALNVLGPKNFVQDHPTDPTKIVVYTALEGNEAGTYTRGSARLKDGTAVIDLPEDFELVTSTEGLTAQVTPRGPVRAMLYVETVSPAQIVVKASHPQDDDVPFDFQVNGVRQGYEDHQAIRERTELARR